MTQSLVASDYHRKPIVAINALLAVLNRLGVAKASLEKTELLNAAKKATGLRDFGASEQAFAQLDVLLEDTEAHSQLTPTGRWLARANILRILKHRLLLEDLLQRHPEILERKMPDPIVIVGPARSGTTRLHRMLAADQRFLHLHSWESVNPVPYAESFAAREAGREDPRKTGIDKALKAVLYMSPQIAAVHPLGTMEVEEEIGLLQHAFSSQIFEAINWLPNFSTYLENNDQTFAYEYMKTLLKVVSWFRNDPEDKPWVLKTPQHIQDLNALIAVFPGAKLICTHRDPIKVVGSVCSTVWNSIVRDSAAVRPEQVGGVWLDKTEWMLRKTLAIRDKEIDPAQQFDVLYQDISSDWQAALGSVYDFLGMPFSEQAKTGMQEFLSANAQHKHGMHKYSLNDFGLDRDEVDRRLMFYRERFSIPYELKNPNAQ